MNKSLTKYIIFVSVIVLILLAVIIFFLIRSNNSPPPPPPQPTWYYPFSSDIKNYASGTGVTDAVMGVSGYHQGGTASFSDGGLVLTGGDHNAEGASYVVLPNRYSGKIASFCCWFKSHNNQNNSRIIDMSRNRTFRISIMGKTNLNFNDEYDIKTNTTINDNNWHFIAINANGSKFSWVLNDGGTGNSGSGSISTYVFFNSDGYLGHSFGNDPEFRGALKEVRFFVNKNLTPQDISTFYNKSK